MLPSATPPCPMSTHGERKIQLYKRNPIFYTVFFHHFGYKCNPIFYTALSSFRWGFLVIRLLSTAETLSTTCLLDARPCGVSSSGLASGQGPGNRGGVALRNCPCVDFSEPHPNEPRHPGVTLLSGRTSCARPHLRLGLLKAGSTPVWRPPVLACGCASSPGGRS